MIFETFKIGSLSVEMSVLALGIILGLLHLFGQAILSGFERGAAWALGPRDSKIELSMRGQRFERAANNFKETFPFVLGVLILIEIAGKSSGFTQGAAVIWLLARVVYYPAYVLGWSVRPYVWSAAIFALIGLIVSVFQ